mgnify:CR=1 FL=1
MKATVLLLLLFISSVGNARLFNYELECIYNNAKQFELDPYLILSIAYVESRLDKQAIRTNKNNTTDIGLFQINSKNLQHKALFKLSQNNTCFASFVASKIYKNCKTKFKNKYKAIDCYNKGSKAKSNSIYVKRVLSVYRYYLRTKLFEKCTTQVLYKSYCPVIL